MVEVVVQVLEIIGPIVAIIACLAIPGLGWAMASFIVAATVFAGNLLLYADGRRSGWDVAVAGIDLAASAATLGASTYGTAGWKVADTGLSIASGFADTNDAGNLEWDIAGGALSIGAVGFDDLLLREDMAFEDALTDVVDKDVWGKPLDWDGFGSGDGLAFSESWEKWATADFSEVFSPQSQQRPEIDLSGIRFDGLDVAVSPADIQVPEINLPDLGSLEIPPVDPGAAPDICSTVEVNVPGTS